MKLNWPGLYQFLLLLIIPTLLVLYLILYKDLSAYLTVTLGIIVIINIFVIFVSVLEFAFQEKIIIIKDEIHFIPLSGTANKKFKFDQFKYYSYETKKVFGKEIPTVILYFKNYDIIGGDKYEKIEIPLYRFKNYQPVLDKIAESMPMQDHRSDSRLTKMYSIIMIVSVVIFLFAVMYKTSFQKIIPEEIYSLRSKVINAVPQFDDKDNIQNIKIVLEEFPERTFVINNKYLNERTLQNYSDLIDTHNDIIIDINQNEIFDDLGNIIPISKLYDRNKIKAYGIRQVSEASAPIGKYNQIRLEKLISSVATFLLNLLLYFYYLLLRNIKRWFLI